MLLLNSISKNADFSRRFDPQEWETYNPPKHRPNQESPKQREKPNNGRRPNNNKNSNSGNNWIAWLIIIGIIIYFATQ